MHDLLKRREKREAGVEVQLAAAVVLLNINEFCEIV